MQTGKIIQPLKHLGRRVFEGTRRLSRLGFEFVYPPGCPLCGRETPGARSAEKVESAVCTLCQAVVAPDLGPSCRRCAAPVGPFLETSNGCIHCRRDRFVFESVICLGVYEGLLRSACLKSKQPMGGPLAVALTELLWERSKPLFERIGVDFVVSVPHHWTHRIGRFHNASVTISEVLARHLKVDFLAHILVKTRRTAAQASLTATKRRLNLRGAFQAGNPAELSGSTVLLGDDVLTTGTTANEVAKALRRGGAARVVVASLARGIGSSSGR